MFIKQNCIQRIYNIGKKEKRDQMIKWICNANTFDIKPMHQQLMVGNKSTLEHSLYTQSAEIKQKKKVK